MNRPHRISVLNFCINFFFAPYITSGLLNLHTTLAGTLIPAIPDKKRVAFILD